MKDKDQNALSNYRGIDIFIISYYLTFKIIC